MSEQATEGMTIEILDVQEIIDGEHAGGLAISTQVCENGLCKKIPYHIPKHKLKEFNLDALKARARRDFVALKEESDIAGRNVEMLKRLMGKKQKI